MTRVLVIEPAGNKWGSERALLDLLDGLDTTGFAVCMPPRRPLEPELRRRGLTVIRSYVYALHEKTKLHRAWAALGVLYACLVVRAQVIYLNQAGAYKVALPAARLLGIPMVAHIRMLEDVAYIARQSPDPRVLRGLILISGAVREEAARHPELAGVPCHTIYDAYALTAQPQAPAATKRAGDRICCVGRITREKGHEVLLDAIALAARPIECLIAGDDTNPFAQRLKAPDRPGSASCRWVGVVEDAVELMRGCVAVAVPSYQEGLGRVVLEAWEAGAVPVVFAGSGGPAEIVAASGGGVIYDEQSGASLARALEHALSLSAGERTALAEKGRAWVAGACDPSAYAARVSAIFAAAAGQGEGR